MAVRIAALCVAVILAGALPADAQMDAFARAVRDFEWRAAFNAPDSPRAIVDRMEAALAEWDRQILAREESVQRSLQGASRESAFKLHVELGLVYGQRGRTTEALREFDAAAALRPDASDVHVLRGLAFEAAAKAVDAGRAFRQAWERDRDNPIKAYYALRDTTSSDTASVQQVLTRAYQSLISSPPDPRGALYVPMGVVNENVSSTPIVGDEALADGFALLAAGRYTQAIAAFRRGAVSTVSPLAHFTDAGRLEAEGRITEARRAYEVALAGTLSGRSRIYIAIGRLALVDGDMAAAIAAFERAVHINPNDGVMHRELALALAADGRHDEAFLELVAALLINADDASALAAIGQIFLDTGRYDDAAVALRGTLRIAPDRFETHYALATALTQLGDARGAAAELERFERGRQAQVERRRRELDEAVDQAEAARRINPDRLRVR
jgi:tetratricopeptide (TPR) repeat protein